VIATVARKELREMARDGRLRLAAAAVLLLLAAALATGWRAWRDASALRESAARATRADWLAQPPKNPHSAAHYGVYAFKPEPALSFVDRGVGSYVGALTWLEAHKQNDLKYRPAQDAAAATRFGEWTAAAVLQLLVPLLVVVLGFAAFAGERERGTLRQLLALGVPPGRLALGKALGVGAALALLLVPAALLGAGALVLAGGGGAAAAAPAGDVALRVLALAAAYLAYFALFAAATLAASAVARSTRTALVLLLAAWALNALVAPRFAADVARAARPAPTALAFNARIEAGLAATREGLTGEERKAQFRDSVLRAYGVTSVDRLPANFAGLELAESERHGDRVFDAAYGDLAATYRAQDRVRAAVAAAAPLLAVRELSMALAGTDAEQFRAFQAAAERYRRALVGRMNDEMARGGRTSDGFDRKADARAWASVPEFAYTPPSAAAVLGRAWPHALALAGWLAAAALALAAGVRRLARTGPDAGAGAAA
jgi:ABC-2 type transport system permease protein